MTAHEDAATGDDPPSVSIVVPVYNDPEGIGVTLDALVAQTYPTASHEILVVDNGSTDRTPAVVRRFGDEHEQVTLLSEPAGGSYTARNAGIRASGGEIVSFVDADMWVEPTWLASVVDRLVGTGAACLGCSVRLGEGDGDASLAERYERRTAFPVEDYAEKWGFVPTCCLTVRREVIEEIGPFDSRLTSSGDLEFGNRIVDAGYDIVFADDIEMGHPPRTTVRSLVEKEVRIGRGRIQLRRYHPERYGRPVGYLLNPLRLTPPTPASMASHVRGWDGLSPVEKVRFGLLAWLLTLATAYGGVREVLDGGEAPSDAYRPADTGSD